MQGRDAKSSGRASQVPKVRTRPNGPRTRCRCQRPAARTAAHHLAIVLGRTPSARGGITTRAGFGARQPDDAFAAVAPLFAELLNEERTPLAAPWSANAGAAAVLRRSLGASASLSVAGVKTFEATGRRAGAKTPIAEVGVGNYPRLKCLRRPQTSHFPEAGFLSGPRDLPEHSLSGALS